ncbi:MAG: bifunctional (p)ppGpp synthetase/guanosine-3',5'-bis(diphosphate) 3'-pyrophosphohydrolase [Actinobacteria bacterium]|nr:MAG: bifunctional (p)ppGpp synthetase/guanosine-3',5'-bis(diphosphate) 3'-pyrophosphohydrolase [Actinomycetota bacterium]
MAKAQSINELIKTVQNYNPQADEALIKKAYEHASRLHEGQKRLSGEAYIEHPLAVANVLAHLELDQATIVAALLHDVAEDTTSSIEDIKKQFGAEVADLINGVTKLSTLTYKSAEERQAENLRKMFVAMAKDIRVVLIKLADRLHNMQTIEFLSKEKQKRIAQETLEIYAPLAHRLGIFQLKWQLEDLSFQAMEPKVYEEIKKVVAQSRKERERYLNQAIKEMSSELKKVVPDFEITGRAKHFYSIYQKMLTKDKESDQIYDLSALRVLVNSVKECYAALGVIHSIWKPIPGRFKDYIAMPKGNMYQSLHTTVIGPKGKPLEIQIRTHQMHKTAEFGIAAHWGYKEEGKLKKEEQLKWLKQMLEWQSESSDAADFLDSLRFELFEDEVFVFTPKGDIINLPAKATPVDFAYSIHTEVGHSLIGAKVNKQIVSLEYRLQMGDIVEILTSKSSSGPSRDWLNIVKTSRARTKIKQWFSKEVKEDSVQIGREELAKALRKYKISLHSASQAKALEKITKDFNFIEVDGLLASIGSGKTSARQAATKIVNFLNKEKEEEIEQPQVVKPVRRKSLAVGINVKGVADVLVRLARCCNPVPNDEIIGFVTRGRGISVHRADCTNAESLMENPERIVEVNWDTKKPVSFQVEILIEALDRPRLLKDISTVISDSGVNIEAASISTTKDGMANFRFIVEIGSMAHLDNILKNVRKVGAVFDARRI